MNKINWEVGGIYLERTAKCKSLLCLAISLSTLDRPDYLTSTLFFQLTYIPELLSQPFWIIFHFFTTSSIVALCYCCCCWVSGTSSKPTCTSSFIRKTTNSFTFLGNAVTNTCSSDANVARQIQAASKAYGARHNRLNTKTEVYNVAALPALLYSTECTILERRHIKKSTAVQLPLPLR